MLEIEKISAQSKEMTSLSLIYYKHNSNTKPTHIRKSQIDYYDLTIVLKGTLNYVFDESSVALKAGDMILIRPGEYRHRLDSGITSDYISFNFITDMELQSIPTVLNSMLNSETNTMLNTCDVFFNKTPDHYLEKIAYILCAFLLHIQDNINNMNFNPLALQIKNYILKNYAKRITLKSIADEFHFSPSYCNSIFKRENRKPIVDFLIEERIRNAQERLIHTNLPLPQIAAEVGYDDYNYFSRLFKKHTLYTPTKYRHLYSGK